MKSGPPQKALRAESSGIKTTGGKAREILIWNSRVNEREFQRLAHCRGFYSHCVCEAAGGCVACAWGVWSSLWHVHHHARPSEALAPPLQAATPRVAPDACMGPAFRAAARPLVCGSRRRQQARAGAYCRRRCSTSGECPAVRAPVPMRRGLRGAGDSSHTC